MSIRVTTKRYIGGKTKQENTIKTFFLNPTTVILPILIALAMYLGRYGLPFHFAVGLRRLFEYRGFDPLTILRLIRNLFTDLTALSPVIVIAMKLAVTKGLEQPSFKTTATVLIVLFYMAFIGMFFIHTLNLDYDWFWTWYENFMES